jgi:hypothetical protein
MKRIWGLLWAKEQTPLKTVPMGKEFPGLLLEPVHHTALITSSDPNL